MNVKDYCKHCGNITKVSREPKGYIAVNLFAITLLIIVAYIISLVK